ncbi:MAG TPA: hypothetical protein VNU48_11635, partial [Burkholderiaceae bacterium]|nr:hypothetical protein [Burkholderiaceae bacterium]
MLPAASPTGAATGGAGRSRRGASKAVLRPVAGAGPRDGGALRSREDTGLDAGLGGACLRGGASKAP